LQEYSPESIKSIFRSSGDFNELFEAFRAAIDKGLNDLDTYRELFWNQSLKPEEMMFFSKKLGDVFPSIGFETYIWLSDVLSSRYDTEETIEIAFLCLKKAYEFNPKSIQPFVLACDLFDEDLRIPTLQSIVEFLKRGLETVENPVPLFERLATFYSAMGNDELARYFRDRKG